jgi:hypothetical protein
MDPVISSGERDQLLRPTQRLRWLGMNEVDLTLVLAVAPSAHVGLEASDDHVDRPLGLLEGTVGVAYLWWRRQVALVAVSFWMRLVAAALITAVVIAAAAAVVTTVVAVAM